MAAYPGGTAGDAAAVEGEEGGGDPGAGDVVGGGGAQVG